MLGSQVNMRNAFLPDIAKMNWGTCNYANTFGFKCVDNLAQSAKNPIWNRYGHERMSFGTTAFNPSAP